MCPAYRCGTRRWPLAIMLSVDRVPVKARARSAVARVGCPGPWPTGVGALQVCCSLQPRCADHSACSVPQAGSDARYGSFLAIIAHAIRAILLASATAATLAERRSINFTNHGCRV